VEKLAFTQEEFDVLKASAEEGYKKIGEIQCPFLNDRVAFNAMGLDHVKLKSWNHARTEMDQFMRLKLLHLAPEVIRKSHTLQGIEEGNRMERVKIHGRWESRVIHVSYHEFISVLKGYRVRVIVKKIDNGPYYFWSIIPYWKQGALKRQLFSGDPETA
jgi:hypothetical protein